MKASLVPLLLIALSGAYGQWLQTNGPGVSGVNAVCLAGADIFAGTDNEGVFRSTNNGSTWSAANAGIEKSSVRCLGASSAYLFAGVDLDYRGYGGVYRMPLDGVAWTPANAGIASLSVFSIHVDGSTVFAGTIGQGVYKSTDNGESWIQSNNGMGDEFVTGIVQNGDVLFASGSNNLYRSDDGGETWVFTNGGQYFQISSLAVDGTYMYAGGFQGLIRSTDSGDSWSLRIDILIMNSISHISGFATDGFNLFASTSVGPGVGVIKSTDHGLTWTFSNNGIEAASLNCLLYSSGSFIAGGSSKGIMLSADDGMTWAKSNAGLPPGGSIRDLLSLENSVIAATGGDGIHQTTDDGETWVDISNDAGNVLRDEIILALEESDSVLFAGTGFNGMYRSTNDGLLWVASNNGLPSMTGILSMTVSGVNVLAGTGEGIFFSSDKGLTWHATNITDGTVSSMDADNGFSYGLVSAGLFTSTGIYRSDDDGITWALMFPTGTTTPVGVAALGQYVLTGSFSPGGFRSVDYGINWTGYSIPDADGVYVLHLTDTVSFAGAGIQSQGVYRSGDFGASFEAFNEGFESFTSVEALTIGNDQLFAGTNDRAVWKRSIGGPTSVAENSIPGAGYRLEQNCPNPFNPTTAISFHLPAINGGDGQAGLSAVSQTSLVIYDLLGREVATLVNGELAPGTYTKQWNATGFASGVYIYRLQASNFSKSGTMLLLR